MKEDDEFIIDGDFINGTFSSRAPKVKLNTVRFLFKDSSAFLLMIIFLFFALIGGLLFALWSKILGGMILVIALMVAALNWRYISVRKLEFKNAVLCPGIVIEERPPTVLILANMTCDGSGQKAWAVKSENCRSLHPFPHQLGTRVPCVSAFLGSGDEGSWDQMISYPLTSGTGNRQKLHETLARLSDEEEWQILEDAIRQKKFPAIGKTLRL